jgi:hypothetical protein
MDVLAAILTCSLHGDDAVVRAIVDNAHDNPLSIVTPELAPETGAASSSPQTLDEAVRQLRDVTAHGGQPLLGLMQVPVAWASAFGREAQDLFDPCINLSIGSAMLSEFDYACANPPGSSARRATALRARRNCAVRRYAEAIQTPELATVVALDLRYQRGPSPPPSAAPIFPSPPESRAWGADRPFLPPTGIDRASVKGAANVGRVVPAVGVEADTGRISP